MGNSTTSSKQRLGRKNPVPDKRQNRAANFFCDNNRRQSRPNLLDSLCGTRRYQAVDGYDRPATLTPEIRKAAPNAVDRLLNGVSDAARNLSIPLISRGWWKRKNKAAQPLRH
jgi:hypothetical protein